MLDFKPEVVIWSKLRMCSEISPRQVKRSRKSMLINSFPVTRFMIRSKINAITDHAQTLLSCLKQTALDRLRLNVILFYTAFTNHKSVLFSDLFIATVTGYRISHHSLTGMIRPNTCCQFQILWKSALRPKFILRSSSYLFCKVTYFSAPQIHA